MPNPALSTLVDAFTTGSINTTLWDNITVGTATLDATNDLVQLAHSAVSGTVNTFGSTALYNAVSSSLYAQITPAPIGNGTTRTILKLSVDANNAISMRIDSGAFRLTLLSAGVTTNTDLGTYDANTHRFWRLREAAGLFYADASPDGTNWTTLGSTAYSWSATAVTFAFQTAPGGAEATGLYATISHINTTRGGPLNPDWPYLEYAWGARWNINAATIPLEQYADVRLRTRGQIATGGGRQYELDQVRARDMSHTWDNQDGAFDPLNTAGPWYGHINLLAPLRIRAQWPPTRNLLTVVQATGGDSGGYSTGTIPQGNTGIAVASATDSSGGTITTSSRAWAGGRVFQFAVPASTASGTSICATSQPAVAIGQPYSAQLQVRNVTAATSLQVAAYIAWYNASGALISTTVGSTATLTGSTTATWTQATASGTAPAGTAYATLGVRTAATSPGSAVTAQVDGWQLEQTATPSSWTCPGTWYPVFAGFMDSYPPQWSMSGTYGTIRPQAYDALAAFSQKTLRDPLVEELYSRSPRFVYTLADPQNSGQVTDSAGLQPFAQIAVSKVGAGSLTLGNAITAANPTTGVYTGSTGTVARLANPNPGTGTISAATYIDLTTANIKGPASSTWSRAIAFRYTGATPTATNQATIWAGFGANYQLSPFPAGSQVTVVINPSGFPAVTVTDDLGNGGTLTISTNVVDSNWHFLIFGAKSGQQFASLDGAYTSSASGYTTQPTLIRDAIGAWLDPTRTFETVYNYAGDLSFACEWPSYLTSTDCSTIYSAWKNSFSGESSNARYARILGWAGYTGPTSLQSGLTTSMGPANSVTGQDALTALAAVVATENGNHYAAKDGTITFKARSDRYNKLAATYTFGDRPELGEIPYEDVTPSYDLTRVANRAAITQQSTNQLFTAQDAASVTAYLPKTLTRTVNSTSVQECQDAASYLVSRYRQPAVRISSLTLHPSANPGLLWPVCLALELGTRIRVVRRSIGAPAITIDCFVENLEWRWDEKGEAYLTLQCSPVDTTPYAVFASFHTTLATSPGAGVTSITINAGADSTNVARAQLTGGQQLVLGLGTANEETVTIAAGGVASTTAGWTTCVITLTAATTKSHTAGDVVCEPLPAGTTSATTWDGTTFDNRAFAY